MRENKKHMVLDADGLYIVTKNLDLVKGYKNCILTPNKNEFGRLAKELGVNLDDKDRSDAVQLAATWPYASVNATGVLGMFSTSCLVWEKAICK